MTLSRGAVRGHDVVVLGSGAAGLTAALAAAAGGADVGLYEKADLLGGTTAISGGIVWVPGNHLMDRSDGIDAAERDADPAEALRYLRALAGDALDVPVAEALVRAFLRGPMDTPAGVPTNTGDGLDMAIDAGAALGNMAQAWWAPMAHIPGEEAWGAPRSPGAYAFRRASWSLRSAVAVVARSRLICRSPTDAASARNGSHTLPRSNPCRIESFTACSKLIPRVAMRWRIICSVSRAKSTVLRTQLR